MSETDYEALLIKQSERRKELDSYKEFVKDRLRLYPETSAAQMHDWLKEHHPSFPIVNPKTIFNFVHWIRDKYNIPKLVVKRQHQVLCVDEKTQIQALDRTQPVLPLKEKAPKRLTVTYKRNGTVALIAALAVHSGEITGKTMKSNNSENFLSFLKKLDRAYRNKTLHIIVDNLSVHKNAKVKEWLASKRKVRLHFTPTYSSWLNQVEIWFNILSKDVLKGAVWKSTKQLTDQMLEYIDTYNKTRAKPFAWTYTGDTLKISLLSW